MPLRIMVIDEADQAAMNQAILDEPTLDVGNPNPNTFTRPVFEVTLTTITGRICGWNLEGGDFGTVVGLAQSGGLGIHHYPKDEYPANMQSEGFFLREGS